VLVLLPFRRQRSRSLCVCAAWCLCCKLVFAGVAVSCIVRSAFSTASRHLGLLLARLCMAASAVDSIQACMGRWSRPCRNLSNCVEVKESTRLWVLVLLPFRRQRSRSLCVCAAWCLCCRLVFAGVAESCIGRSAFCRSLLWKRVTAGRPTRT